MKNRNIELTILKALGIIAVVSCHLGVNIFNIIGIPLSLNTELFPEYSYHMPLFIFTSGYFYKRAYEHTLFELSIKRSSNLIKYLKCNLFYFALCFILVNLNIFSIQGDFSLRSLFIEPFLGGFQFHFNGPGWFVPFLFCLQLIFVIIRKLFGLIFKFFKDNPNTSLTQETVFLIFLILIGVMSTSIAAIYPVINNNLSIIHSFLRVLFGLQFFELGFFYKEFIENKLKLSIISFAIVILSKILFNHIFGYYTFSLRTLKFNSQIILPLITSILGIAYCLHLTKFIISIGNKLNTKAISILCLIGNNTWPIMMHHLLIKWCLASLYSLKFLPSSFSIIGNYFISPLLCILLPISLSYLHKNLMSSYFLTKSSRKATLQ